MATNWALRGGNEGSGGARHGGAIKDLLPESLLASSRARDEDERGHGSRQTGPAMLRRKSKAPDILMPAWAGMGWSPSSLRLRPQPRALTLRGAFNSPLHRAGQDEEVVVLREEVERIKQQLDVLSCLSSLSALACLVDLPLVSTSGYTHNSQEEPRNFPPIAIKHPLQLHPHQQQQLQQQQHTLPPPMRRSIHLGSTRIPDSQTPSLPDSVPLLSSHYPHIDVQREIIDLDREYAKALVIKERLARELTAQTMAQWHGTTHEPEPAEAQDAVSRLPQPPAPSEQELGPRSQTIAVPLDKVPVPSSSSSPGEELIGALLLGDSRHRLPQDASRVKEWEMRERVPVLKAFRHDALRQSLS